jgi:Serine proteases of the peptidase family S9A
VGTTEDERFAILTISDRGRGKKGNSLWFRGTTGSWQPIVSDIGDDDYEVVDDVGSDFLIRTNHGAPNERVLRWSPARPAAWTTVLPERAEPLQSVEAAGGKLFATYTKDVTTRAYVYDLQGKLENEIALPGLGTANGFAGNHDDRAVFYTYSSFDYPPSIFRYDIASRTSTLFRAPEIPGFHAGDYVTEQVFFHSRDGTRVPMFLTTARG